MHGKRSPAGAQHSTAQHSTAQHSTAQHSTAQHSTAQHSTAQHSTACIATSACFIWFALRCWLSTEKEPSLTKGNCRRSRRRWRAWPRSAPRPPRASSGKRRMSPAGRSRGCTLSGPAATRMPPSACTALDRATGECDYATSSGLSLTSVDLPAQAHGMTQQIARLTWRGRQGCNPKQVSLKAL